MRRPWAAPALATPAPRAAPPAEQLRTRRCCHRPADAASPLAAAVAPVRLCSMFPCSTLPHFSAELRFLQPVLRTAAL